MNAQEVTYVFLIVNGEAMKTCSQVRDHCVYRRTVWAKYNAVVDIDKEDDAATIIQAWIDGTRLETDLFHALVHVFVPYTTRLFLTIHIMC